MQKQLDTQKNETKYLDVKIDDDFPLLFFEFTQTTRKTINLHYHDSYEIGLCLSGNGLFFVDNKILPFRQNYVSFIPPNQPHIAQTPNELSSDWIFFSVDLSRLFFDESFLSFFDASKSFVPALFSPATDKDLPVLLEMLYTELKDKKENYKENSKSLLKVFLLKLLRYTTTHNEISTPTQINRYASIAPALDYISTHYSEEITSEKLASACNLSETHFRTVFKKATSYTPMQYLASVRMRMAKTLLKSTTIPIIEVSEKVGYSSISCFNRTFKSLYGITPSDYRK